MNQQARETDQMRRDKEQLLPISPLHLWARHTVYVGLLMLLAIWLASGGRIAWAIAAGVVALAIVFVGQKIAARQAYLVARNEYHRQMKDQR